MNKNMIWLLSKYIHRKDWLSFLKLNTTFYEFGSLLSSGINPSIYHNETIKRAARKGHIKMVESLLQDPRVELSDSNIMVYYNDNVKVGELLLQDPQVQNEYDIMFAAQNGYVKVVELLLKDTRIKLYAYNVAIRYAVVNGYDEIVEILLKDPRVKISPWFIDIKNFLKDGYEKAIELLLQDPRVDPSISHNDTI